MSTSMTDLKEQLSRRIATAKKAREGTKMLFVEVGGTLIGGATSAGLGALDWAKGTVAPNDTSGLKTCKVGPVPVSIMVAGAGKAGALILLGDSIAPLASDFGQAGVDVASWSAGYRMMAAYQAKSKKAA